MKKLGVLFIISLLCIYLFGALSPPSGGDIATLLMNATNESDNTEQIKSLLRFQHPDKEAYTVGPLGLAVRMSHLFAATSRKSFNSTAALILLEAGADPKAPGFQVGPFGILVKIGVRVKVRL